MRDADPLVIPYGTTGSPIDATGAIAAGVPVLRIDRQERRPLRLNSAPYPFAEPPDPIRLAALADRLDFLCDHLLSFCGLWDRLPRLFLELYFRAVATEIAANRPALATRAAAAGGIFDVADWSFSALRPLPQAHLPLPPAEAGRPSLVRADFAFWTGRALVAIELVGSAGLTRARAAALDAMRQGDVTIVEVAGAMLQRDGECGLAAALPAPFHRFWEGEALPSSPFGRAVLDDILVAPADDPG